MRAAKEEEDRQRQLAEYQAKLAEIERLKRLKEEQMTRMGQAHAEAQESKRKHLQAEVEKNKQQIKDTKLRRARGQEVFTKERQLEEEKRRLEEQLLCVERKKQVQGQESAYAHNVAQKYRLEQEQSHLIDKEIKNLKMEPNQQAAGQQLHDIKDFKNIDYTQTRFHTIKTTANPALKQRAMPGA